MTQASQDCCIFQQTYGRVKPTRFSRKDNNHCLFTMQSALSQVSYTGKQVDR